MRLADGLDVGYESDKGVENDRVFTLSRWKDGVTITLDGKDKSLGTQEIVKRFGSQR